MQRSRISGFIACAIAVVLAGLFINYAFVEISAFEISNIGLFDAYTYYALAIPIALVALGICGTGFWVGWTILTIKVAPPMPEIVEKKDYAKVKALFLCLFTLGLAALFIYGLYIRNYWALAIPAAAVTLVVLGMVFWVGIAIISARSTLPEDKKQ
ncbi:MAG: hypothetical protein MUC76_13665 [Spirochaetes bacterium]|jgi:uncharacterized protein with PQ loop repeat|nr:hypothetical protein [Spirochaetota bacterium]